MRRTSAGTRFDLAPREIPQSLSIISHQRIEDQKLDDIIDVLANTTGVTSTQSDSERTEFYARGFYIDAYQFDGLPTQMVQNWSYGDSGLDLALYDRVEVVRGATGLLSGAGNPSASVNLIRKHADSAELAGSVSVNVGSWGRTRTTVDVGSALNASGSVRGRVIGSYLDTDGQMDRYNQRKTLGYAVIDADLTPDTQLSVGYDYQQKRANGATWGGFPMLYSDGSRTGYDESFNASPGGPIGTPPASGPSPPCNTPSAAAGNSRWAPRTMRPGPTTSCSTRLQRLDHGRLELRPGHWRGHLAVRRPVQHRAQGHWRRRLRGWPVPAVRPRAPADGRPQLQQARVRQLRRLPGRWPGRTWDPFASYLNWTGKIGEPNWNPLALASEGTITQKAGYAAARLSLADPLKLIIGARYTDWKSEGEGADRAHKVTTPYAGLVFDINGTYSTYASYTEIFQPQTLKDRNGSYLDPVDGKSYEVGVKGAWFDNRLNASLAVFRIEQDNVGQATGEPVQGSQNEFAYRAARGTVSRGFEFEVNGELATGWNATFGASRYVAKDINGADINTNLPQTALKLFTSYTPQSLQALTVGGGANWQNRIYYPVPAYGRIEQSGYALVSAFLRYRISPEFSVQANLNNLLDKKYLSQVSGYGAYGDGRNGSLTFTWAF